MARLDFAMLANAAAGPPDNLIYVLGGGIDTVSASQFPVPLIATLVIRLLRNRTEVSTASRLRIEIQDQDGNAILLPGPAGNQVAVPPIHIDVPPVTPAPGLPPHWEIASNAIIPIVGLPLPHDGLYSIEILVNDQWVRSLPLRVVVHQSRT